MVEASELLFIPPGGGRAYACGAMRGVFKADGGETADRYCVSEWWVAPRGAGPGLHSHEANEELFYVLEGTMTFTAGDDIVEAPQGSFLRIPRGMPHDFENRTDAPAGVLNVYVPGGFEQDMPAIVAWFAEQAGARV